MEKKLKLKVLRDLNNEEIGLDKVIYLEGSVNYTNFHTTEKVFISSHTLKKFEILLEGNRFIRIHKSHIVNIEYITRVIYMQYAGKLWLNNGIELEISRRKLSFVREKLKRLSVTKVIF